MTSRRLQRGHVGSQTFDPSNWQPMFEDDRLWVVAARVDLHEGETSHFFLDVDETGARVLYVDVVTAPGEVELRCVMPCTPIARIPALGEMVFVSLADGRLDFRPSIIAVVGNPGAGAGLTEDRWVMQLAPGQKLLIHAGDASAAKKLATIDDVQAARFNDHVHADPASGFTGPPLAADHVTPVSADDPVGTQTLEVE